MAKRCQICRHPDKHRMEVLLAGGASVRAVAKKFSTSYHALWRHWNHVTPSRKRALIIGPCVADDLAKRIADENTSVLDHLKAVRAGLYVLFDNALEAGDGGVGSLLAGRLHQNLSLVGTLTGALASSGLVSQTNIQTNIFVSPQFAELQAALIRTLAAYPEARAAVIREFRKLEGPLIDGKAESNDGRKVSAAAT